MTVPEWYKRYDKPVYDFKWPSKPEEREENFYIIGTDSLALLNAVYQDPDREWLRHIPAVDVLRQEWKGSFHKPHSPWACVARVIVAQPKYIFSI